MFNIRDVAISIGLLILIPFALIYGLSTFMKRSSFPCTKIYDLENRLRELKKEGLKETIERIQKKIEQLKKDLELEQKEFARKVSVEEIEHVEKQIAQEKIEFEERKLEYEKDIARYDFNYMIISLVVGMIAFLIGLLLVESLGTGLIFGGAICMIYGLSYYWNRFNDITRFSILLGAVLLLFVLGYVHFLRTRKLISRVSSKS